MMQLVPLPLLPLPVVIALAVLLALVLVLTLWRGLSGWWLRSLAALAALAALLNPALKDEDRVALPDIIVALVDGSASQSVSDRPAQTDAALERLRQQVSQRPNAELREVTVGDGDGDRGTEAMAALTRTLADVPRSQLAGVVLLSDGVVHDMDSAPELPVPFHLLQSGRDGDWDRRLIVRNAPAFGIVGEEIKLTVRIEDQGAAPQAANAELVIAVDGGKPLRFQAPIGTDMELPLKLPHGGMNVVQFSTPGQEGELTERNNAAVIQINGVRDRLRVLLVSGEPHAGERTWRNLLKSDANVDLVHFTILRPLEKQDGTPVNELALIAFPSNELFMQKIDEFDLIVFDRYKRRGILPSAYFQNIRRYVEDGGAILVSGGPEFAGAESIWRSPLGAALPGQPTAKVVEEGFLPTVTDLGARHPVTRDLQGNGDWGRWFRQIEVEETSGTTVLSGKDERPLLILDRVGEGRVALLASDHVWLWARGVDGGGPQQELLRRLAHWLMQEPELEEEALTARAQGAEVEILRQTLGDAVGPVTITGPDGTVWEVPLEELAAGAFGQTWEAPEMGLYRLTEGELTTVLGVGTAAPREFEETIAGSDRIEPLLTATRGGVHLMEAGDFTLRAVRTGRPASGQGWLGYTPREAFETVGLEVRSLLPAWVWLLLTAGFIALAWLVEGRRS